jgi:hypothetical protein
MDGASVTGSTGFGTQSGMGRPPSHTDAGSSIIHPIVPRASGRTRVRSNWNMPIGQPTRIFTKRKSVGFW